MIKNILMGSAALLVIAGAANAADLPVKAQPVAPYVNVGGFNWSGIYVGIHGGWEWNAFNPGLSTNDAYLASLTNPGVLGANATGGFVGGHIGLNNQQGAWVFGVRTDFDLSGLQGSVTDATGNVVTHSIPWHGDVVGKLGYLVAPQVLFYGVGGLAYGEVKDAAATGLVANSLANTVCVFNPTGTTATACALSSDNVHIGWTAGLGLEYAINPNILVGLEWDYVNLGTHGVQFVGPQNAPMTFNVSDKAAWNSIKGMLTFKF